MAISLVNKQILNNMANLLYNFLPSSFNNNYSFPIAAKAAGVLEFWIQGSSKEPAILNLLSNTFLHKRSQFCVLITKIVELSMSWRSNKSDLLTKNEIIKLNELLLRLGYKIPDLWNEQFLNGLKKDKNQETISKKNEIKTSDEQANILKNKLLDINNLPPQKRGFEFEKFLKDFFSLSDLAPRSSFRLEGEQIDGSFQLSNNTYLVEAKWQATPIGNRELQSFAGSVRAKSQWSRGIYISYSGFSSDGITAFSKGLSTPIICMTGHELWNILEHNLKLSEILESKIRHTAETGTAFVEFMLLYPSL